MQVVCAAAVGLQPFEYSQDKPDKSTTHLAHFVLINRFLPFLGRTAPISTSQQLASATDETGGVALPMPPTYPRIVALSSTLHTAASPTVLFLTLAELSSESGKASPLCLHARATLSTVLFNKHPASLSRPTIRPCSPLPPTRDPYTPRNRASTARRLAP